MEVLGRLRTHFFQKLHERFATFKWYPILLGEVFKFLFCKKEHFGGLAQ